jgi:hypothetical protein
VLLDRQARSGLTAGAFCDREDVSKSSFARWRAMLGAARESPPAFLELPRVAAAGPMIHPGAGAGSGLHIELDLGAGIVLRITR